MHIFSRDPALWGKLTQMLWGFHDICPPNMIPGERCDLIRTLSPIPHRGMGDTEKPQCNMAYLLMVLGKTIEGEMAFGLATVWAHPHQVCLSSLDEAVRKLTILINIGDNWAYAFLQLNEGALHLPLPNKGHIGTMINGSLSRKPVGISTNWKSISFHNVGIK